MKHCVTIARATTLHCYYTSFEKIHDSVNNNAISFQKRFSLPDNRLHRRGITKGIKKKNLKRKGHHPRHTNLGKVDDTIRKHGGNSLLLGATCLALGEGEEDRISSLTKRRCAVQRLKFAETVSDDLLREACAPLLGTLVAAGHHFPLGWRRWADGRSTRLDLYMHKTG